MRARGFTLVELLAGMIIVVLVTAAAVTITYQTIWGTKRSNSLVTPAADVNQAALIIKRDLMASQSTNLTDNSLVAVSSVMLTWFDQTVALAGDNTTRDHSCNYTLSGGNLLRTYDTQAGIIGRLITYIGFKQSGRDINVVITATSTGVPAHSETLNFTVQQRWEAQ